MIFCRQQIPLRIAALRTRALFGIALWMVCELASAYSFQPTPREWLGWPAYCKAKYTATNIGQASQFGRRVSDSFREKWRQQIGDLAYLHVHHGCAGMIYFLRASVAFDERSKEINLDNARKEVRYTYLRVPPPHPINIRLRVVDAKIAYARGDVAEARNMLLAAQQDAPDSAEVYYELARLDFKAKRYEAAVKTLQQGIEQVAQPSVDLHYFLGLVYFDMKDYARSYEQASVAYELGSRLPALRRKLKSVGHWTTAQEG